MTIGRAKMIINGQEVDGVFKPLDLLPLSGASAALNMNAGHWTMRVRIVSGANRLRGALAGPWIVRTRSGHWLVKGLPGSTRRYRTRALAARVCNGGGWIGRGGSLGDIEAYLENVRQMQDTFDITKAVGPELDRIGAALGIER